MPEETVSLRVTAGVQAWLRWLPKWEPGTYRARGRLCRRCLHSPIVRAAGLDTDVPHQVQHALVSRMQKIIDRTVDEFIAESLPHLHAELAEAQPRTTAAGYQPTEGLDPEYEGMAVDPDPEPGQPFLFTLEGLAEPSLCAPALRPALTQEQKVVLRSEMALADECATVTGQRVCKALDGHIVSIRAAVATCVEPQVQAMLAELTHSLEFPQ